MAQRNSSDNDRRPANADAREDRDYDYRYTRNDEGDSSVRAGSYDQGRRQYSRRDAPSGEPESRGRQDDQGGNFRRGMYGEGGSRGRFSGDYGQSGYGYGSGGFGGAQGTSAWRGHGPDGDFTGEPLSFGYGGRGAGLHRGKGPKGYQRSDDRLKEMICERLSEDPHIDASDVTVSVQNSYVTLEGWVDSRRTKYLIEDVVEQFGVSDVQNNLRVQRPGMEAQSRNSSSDAVEQSKQKRN